MITRTCNGCGKPYETFPSVRKAYCSNACYTKIGSANPKWRGGAFMSGGYRYIYTPTHPYATQSGHVVEHRLVMEKKLKRTLHKHEIVHHIDGNKSNNRIKNLVLCQSNGEHAAEHNRSRQRDSLGRFV